MAAIVTQRDEAQIDFYFRAQSRFERSTAGPMLERAEVLGTASDGKRLAMSRDEWNWQPDDTETELKIHETRLDGGYVPDEQALIAFAQASRRMLAVERVSPIAKVALEAFYGDRGSCWAVKSQDSVGPGAIAALFVLTKEGAALIEAWRTPKKGKAPAVHLTDDEVLANVFAVQKAQPNAIRRVRLMKVQDAAEALLRAAWLVWAQTAPERRRRMAA